MDTASPVDSNSGSEMPSAYGGRFVIISELVKRPNCTVYKATDSELGNREIALKVFSDRPGGDQAAIASFNEEVAALRRASHPALVPILAAGCENDWFYIAMELINGATLRDALKTQPQAYAVDEAVEIIFELGSGLAEIHETGIYHGHIDSRGILMKGEKPALAGYCPRAIDRIQSQMTSVGRFTVDPAYIAPEQLGGPGGDADRRVDIYALGVLFYELLTGAKPFESSNPLQTAMLRLTQSPSSPAKLNTRISPLVDAVVLKALSKDPNGRFNSMSEFLEAIKGSRKSANVFTEVSPLKGTETIAVSMSADSIKQLLAAQESRQGTLHGEVPTASPLAGGGDTLTPNQGAALGAQLGAMHSAEATLMGVSPSQLLRGSFIAVEGDLRGKRFILDRPQILIGSDPNCDISIFSKSLPARYAIVVQRGDGYNVAPLSPTGIVLNGEKLGATDEVALKRGDVLTVAGNKLRFVAPGEAFTLQENVADRAIDRPKSKLPLVVTAIATAVILVTVGVLYMYKQTQAQHALMEKKREIARKQKADELVQRLLREGDEFFRNGALVEPEGANAKDRFDQILKIVPDHAYAKKRLSEIDERLQILAENRRQREEMAQRTAQMMAQADQYFKDQAYVAPPGRNAKETYQEVLKIDPNNTAARERIAEIDKLLGNVLERVNVLVAKAQQYNDAGQYVLPRGENAYEAIQEALRIDPQNQAAKSMLYDMAAKNIFKGDQAKKRADLQEMRRSYLTAQALGVDPDYVKTRLQGTDVIERATGSAYIIVDRNNDAAKSNKKKDQQSPYLDTEELERRVSKMALDARLEGNGKERSFIELKGGRR